MKFNYQSYSLKPGIYKITNTHSNRIYIGQAKRLKERWASHSAGLRSNKHQNKFLQNDFNKCKEELGHDDFLVFEVIEVMEGSTKEERNKREEWWISQHYDNQGSCYNFRQKVTDKERTHYSSSPEETKRKQSESMKKLWDDPEYKVAALERMHTGKKIALGDETFRAELGASISSSKKANGALISEKLKERWADPESRKAISEKLKEVLSTDESRQRKKEAYLKVKAQREVDPVKLEEYKRKCSEHSKRLWEDGLIPREQSEETRALLSAKAKERFASGGMDHLKAHCFKATAYEVIGPDDNLMTIENLSKFCKENGFSFFKFKRMLKGITPSYKGYKLPLSSTQSSEDATI
jgi:group I intron endonuclease